jgi:hypothetical protein
MKRKMHGAIHLIQVGDTASSYANINDHGACEPFFAGPLVNPERIEYERANSDRVHPRRIVQGELLQVWGTMHDLI